MHKRQVSISLVTFSLSHTSMLIYLRLFGLRPERLTGFGFISHHSEKALQARTMAPVSVDSRPAEKEMEGKEEGGGVVVVLANTKWR